MRTNRYVRPRSVTSSVRDSLPEVMDDAQSQSCDIHRRRRADIAFTRQKVAVFIDGCFWHGCDDHFVPPKQNAEFWRLKIESNQKRDVDTDSRLAELGWVSIRVWEHQPTADAVDVIAAAVRARET